MAIATNFLPVTKKELSSMAVGAEWESRIIFKGPTVYGNISKGLGLLSKILATDCGLSRITFIQMFASVSGTYVPMPLSKVESYRHTSIEVLANLSTSGAEVADEVDLSAQRFLVVVRGTK